MAMVVHSTNYKICTDFELHLFFQSRCPVINLPEITFQYGRIDCSTSPSTTDVNVFPDASWDRETLMTYFSDHFGFTTDEVCKSIM